MLVRVIFDGQALYMPSDTISSFAKCVSFKAACRGRMQAQGFRGRWGGGGTYTYLRTVRTCRILQYTRCIHPPEWGPSLFPSGFFVVAFYSATMGIASGVSLGLARRWVLLQPHSRRPTGFAHAVLHR